MFERFTEPARQVVVLAQEEARGLKHNYIGTEHILLGLLREEEGLAARVLESLDIRVDRVRAEVVRIIGSGDEVTADQIPFTPRTKKVLELTLREALNLGYDYIGPEHILLGLVRENEGVAARILLDFDADSEKIRNEVLRALYRQSNPEGAEDPDEPELRRYFERRAKDRRKQVLEPRRIGRTRALAGVRSYLEQRSEDLPPERVRASGLLVWEAMKQALPEGEQDRALSKEEFSEAIRRLDLAKRMLTHIRDMEDLPKPEESEP